MVNCDKCIANINGQCVADQCQGEITSMHKPSSSESAKRLYEMAAEMLQEDFENA